MLLAGQLGMVQAADDPSRIEKLGRILAIEDERGLWRGELELCLRDPEPGIRRRAALAAGRLGAKTAAPALIALLNDPEPEVRQMAAFALGLLGTAGDPQTVERLVAALQDTDARVRARAAEALGRTGDARAAASLARFVREAVPRGAPLLTIRGDDPGSAEDPWIELRLALIALGELKDPQAAREALLPSGQPSFDWWAATYCAMRLESPELRPVLLSAAESSDPLSRAWAARGLGALRDVSALDRLARLVRDPDQGVVVHALGALGAIGDRRGLPAVAAALDARDTLIQQEALRAIALLPPDRALAPKVVPFLGHSEPWMRAAAFVALGRIAPGELPLVLSGMEPDPVWFVRAGAAKALGMAGDDTCLGILHGMLRDEDVRLLPAALDALRQSRGADALSTLQEHLEHPDVAVRATAAEGLQVLGVPGQAARLASALHRSVADRDLGARQAILSALAAQQEPAARQALEEAARTDPSRAIRAQAAAALLGDGGVQPPDPGPAILWRPALDHRDAMAPYDPRSGSPVFTPRAFVHTRSGRIEIHLDVLHAPLTCESFVALSRRGFYDGLAFHRVAPHFVVQGGCPRGDGHGGPGYTLRCEIGPRPFGRGAVGITHSGRDTGGSQFFITLAPQPQLDGRYTRFGQVVEGMEVVSRIRPGDTIQRVEVWDGR